ncbi:hypothetical protein GCM10018782_10540 [Streptomyces griseoaurantiacus]|nr:hypothetical protein GCM10018782_10540 [Streptomyces griseoaurantiacus]
MASRGNENAQPVDRPGRDRPGSVAPLRMDALLSELQERVERVRARPRSIRSPLVGRPGLPHPVPCRAGTTGVPVRVHRTGDARLAAVDAHQPRMEKTLKERDRADRWADGSHHRRHRP